MPILHALVLGPGKYLASYTKNKLSAAALDKMQVHMEAFPTHAIHTGKQLNAAYLIKHAASLVGKELRLWIQATATFLAPLVVSGDVSRELWRAWFTLGQLARVLLIDEVKEADQELYMVSASLAFLLVLNC